MRACLCVIVRACVRACECVCVCVRVCVCASVPAYVCACLHVCACELLTRRSECIFLVTGSPMQCSDFTTSQYSISQDNILTIPYPHGITSSQCHTSHRHEEGQGLAGPCLGSAQHIPAGQCVGDGGTLDGRHVSVPGLLHSATGHTCREGWAGG